MKHIKIFAFVGFLAITVLICSFASFAEEKDYSIGDCWWNTDTEGIAKGEWDSPESSTSYKVMLTRGSKTVLAWKSSSSTKYDFTSLIVKNGTGEYTFAVYPNKGGEALTVVSDVLDVDSEMLKALKNGQKAIEEEKAREAASDGWHSYPNNTWTYGKGNNTLAKNEWMNIGGVTYYFNSKGYMVTGWQLISGFYYYFDKTSGALWRNATTPDGYVVNGDGIWVNDAGQPSQVTAKTGSVSVSITENGADGTVRSAVVSGVSGATLVSWSFASDPSTWRVGYPVELTVVVSPRKGAKFTSDTRYSANLGKVLSTTGSDPLTIKISYTPRMRLLKPQNVYMGDDSNVKWTAVSNAKAYRVKIYDGTSLEKTKIVAATHCDLSDYYDTEEYSDINVTVSALGSSNGSSDSNYLESETTSLGAISEVFNSEEGVPGRFSSTTAGLMYRDEYGDKVTGWQKIGGFWYFFGKDYIAKTGWYKDTDANWYYFDGQSRMCVGNVNDGTGVYFMNDGSNASVPYGAWVH